MDLLIWRKHWLQVPRDTVRWPFTKPGLRKWLFKIVKSMYRNAWSRVRSNQFASDFLVQVGLHKAPRLSVKGYLCYKTRIFQNLSSEAQVKNLLVSQKNYVPLPWYSSFYIFNHPMIYQICDVMMSLSTWDRVPFWKYLLNHNSLSHQTWPIDKQMQRQQFSGIFWIIQRTGLKFQVLFNLATCSNYSITNYVKIPEFHFFENV